MKNVVLVKLGMWAKPNEKIMFACQDMRSIKLHILAHERKGVSCDVIVIMLKDDNEVKAFIIIFSLMIM